MKDFTVYKYNTLIVALKSHKGYMLRHDVDARPDYALRVANTEAEHGIHSTYYFRSMYFSSSADIIRAIADRGHTIGYHYENLTHCDGSMVAAYDDFCRNLALLRTIVPCSTASAHGSPTSQWDNQLLWEQYDRHSLGIDFEPMLDTDFSHTLYLTDTGRRWDGASVSIRDKIQAYSKQWKELGLSFHSTDDIISALLTPSHPIHSMNLLINTHPQRWMPFGPQWIIEAIAQYSKNIAKHLIVCIKS